MEHDEALVQAHTIQLSAGWEKIGSLERRVDALEARFRSLDEKLSRIGWMVAANMGGVAVILAVELLKR